LSRSSLAALLLGLTLLTGCEGPKAAPAAYVPVPPLPEPRKLTLTSSTSVRQDEHVRSVNTEAPPISPITPGQAAILQSGTTLQGKEKIELSGPLYNGKKLDWDSYRGKVVLVIEWASWCQYCRSAMDQMEGALKHFENQPFAIVGLNIDSEVKAATAYLDSRKPTFQNIVDSKQRMAMVKKFPIKQVPTYIFVNKAGRRVELGMDDPNVWGKIDVLLQEPYDPNNPDANPAEAEEPMEEPPTDVFGEEKKEEKEPDKPLGKPLRERIQSAKGEEFLELHGPTYSGNTFDWASYRGQAVIVVFWASWDPHSKELLTQLESLPRVTHTHNVAVVGVNVDRVPEQAISFLDVAELPFENILDGKQDMELDREYPTTAVPVMVAVNKAGKIVPFDFVSLGLEKRIIELGKEKYSGPMPRQASSAPQGNSAKTMARKTSVTHSASKPTDDGTLVEAKVGAGKKGRGYGGDIYTEPLKALWSTKEKLVFDVQIPKAMSLFKATKERHPNSHEEFMKEIIEESSIQLPELPEGQKFVYLPEEGKLMIKHPETK
jgi:thiol-disulfide isomerase/thioredoxin